VPSPAPADAAPVPAPVSPPAVSSPRPEIAAPVELGAPVQPPEAVAKPPEDNPLLPPGEKARMATRHVAPGIDFTPGEGIMIESEDHAFSVGLGFRFQLLYTFLDKDPTAKKDVQSLQIRRARVQLAGHAFGIHNKYRLEMAISPSDVALTSIGVTTSPLLEAYTEFDYLRDLTVRAGQFKVPYDRMRVTSDMARQLVDYAGTTAEFSQDRDIGIDLNSKDLFGLGLLRYHLALLSGKGRNSFAATDTGLMYLARVEVLPLGLFEDYPEGDFQRTGPRLSIGGAYAHITDARRDHGTTGNAPLDAGGSTDFNMAEGDLVFKWAGLSLLGGFYWRHGDRNPGSLVDSKGNALVDASGKDLTTPSASRDGTGLVAQGGYLIPRVPFEIAARYANIRGKTATEHNGLKDSNELGGGVSYYFAQHQLKLQTDYFRVYSGDVSSGYNQVRLQLQLVM
jgi:hypothetical protein